MNNNSDLKKEAVFLAMLTTVIAAYKMWRFFSVGDSISKLTLAGSLASNVITWYLVFKMFQKN